MRTPSQEGHGTLGQAEVQLALYGRAVETVPDVLPGYRLDWVRITDAEVIATSGSDRHPIVRRGEDADSVAGAFLELDDDELAATDDYEVDDYVRTVVGLASGVEAWVYTARDPDLRPPAGARPHGRSPS